MAGRRLRCPDEDYEYLQRLRDWLITDKIALRHLEERAEMERRMGRLEEAERTHRLIRLYHSRIRQTESEIKKLEEKCFAGEA
jgi:hypothetical protein